MLCLVVQQRIVHPQHLLDAWRQVKVSRRRRLLGAMLPFALMGFGFWWTNAVFQRQSADYLESLGRVSLVRGSGFDIGFIVFLRAINFGLLSYLFVHATRPADLALALMQHLRLSPAFAYSVFAVVQFIPALRDDLRQLRLARRLRGGRVPWHRAPAAYAALLIPLLAGAVRRAQRSAISMEARGLSRDMARSYLRRSTFAAIDSVFLFAAAVFLAGVIALALI